MPLIGLTGGYASGKSLVSSVFAKLGGKVIDCDVLAREVVEPDSDGLSLVVEAFGEKVLSEDQALDRWALADIVFSDTGRRHELEAILHPLIRKEVFRRADLIFEKKRTAKVVVEAPLLFEYGLYRMMSKNVLVTCLPIQQLERGMRRDSSTITEAELRINAQWPFSKKKKLADIVIDNSDDEETTRASAKSAWQSLSHSM